MKILLTGANGYIGVRLLPVLLDMGHDVVCLVRDRRRFPEKDFAEQSDNPGRLSIIEGDLLDAQSLRSIPNDIDVAYYLVHSMGSSGRDFYELEARCAENFSEAIGGTQAKQVIFLSGIVNESQQALSRHLASRKNVEDILRAGPVAATVLRAAIIVGAGSASFEILRDLVEKLPVMIAPKWLKTRCQPIAIRNVIDYLTGVIGMEAAKGEIFDIAGPEAYPYRELLLQYAEVRGLKRYLVPVPFLTPRLSSYWLYFVTTTSYSLARHLVDSLSFDMSSSDSRIKKLVPLELITYRAAVNRAFTMIQQNQVKSSWIDSLSSGRMEVGRLRQVEVPTHGVLTDRREVYFERDPDEVAENIWRIGGNEGWYTMDWAWQLRGWMDRLVGGSGLRRGRRHPSELNAGDALDFWRVLVADRDKRRLALYAEMKLPGEAWLEFRIEPCEAQDGRQWKLVQMATFRPRGLFGRLYWLAVLPFHYFVFQQMADEVVNRIRQTDS